jgi:hypothetical protein
MKPTSIALLSLLVPATAAAQPAAGPAPAPYAAASAPAEKANSINVSPLGLLFGNYALTYERLFDGTHGVIGELGWGRSRGDSGSASHGAAAVGYRWHWRGRQNSGFLGATFTQSYGGGTMTYDPGTPDERSYDMTVRSTMLTANVGKRWMLGDSFNVTLRFGLGWGHHVASAKMDSPGARDAESDMNAILAFLPVGAEGELSIGYNF